MTKPKEIKLRKDGEPSNRGHGEGSKATRLGVGDGRKRPGRPRGLRDDATQMRELMGTLVTVSIEGKRRKVSVRMAIYYKQVQKALAGDHRSAALVETTFSRFAPPPYDPDPTRELLDDDEEILRQAGFRGLLPAEPPEEEAE